MNIYFIAGPPGIGKSTYGRELVPKHIPIVDHDLAAYQYKKRGFADYSQVASIRANQFIEERLGAHADFELELNLGYQSHYDYLKTLSLPRHKNRAIHLILFFTDHVDLCKIRAKARFENGGHLVSYDIIDEMYENTIPLLRQNINLFASISFVSVTGAEVEEVSKENMPLWVLNNDLAKYLRA
ncbi:hypothetical protein [Dyadobacter sp. CY347]|uniref:hypothetical protein n=1 Tax=Dyadobacter sp. CY347 TaxID=2909336 RepID=UPI001F2FD802|nr:hypothetical protein [Dyadobacter sp. CY347]MCF2488294.1 hypothetical protein [Dyadobacter sp. CY347]